MTFQKCGIDIDNFKTVIEGGNSGANCGNKGERLTLMKTIQDPELGDPIKLKAADASSCTALRLATVGYPLKSQNHISRPHALRPGSPALAY